MKAETRLLFDEIEKGNGLAVKGLLYGTRAICENGRVQKTVASGQPPVDCHGIDPLTGDTALHAVLKAPSDTVIQLATKRDMALLLMTHGIDMTVTNHEGFTALQLAERKPETVKGLDGEPYANMLLKAKEAFERYYQKPPASAAGSGRQPQTYRHDLSSVPSQQLRVGKDL